MSPETKQAAAPEATTTEFDGSQWLDQATTRMRVNDDEAARKRGLDALSEFVQSAMKPGQTIGRDVETTIKVWINAIDQKLTDQLNEVMHHPAYQKLEGTWRGL